MFQEGGGGGGGGVVAWPNVLLSACLSTCLVWLYECLSTTAMSTHILPLHSE